MAARSVYGVLARHTFQGTSVNIGQRRIAKLHPGAGKSRRIYHLCSFVFGQKQRADIEEVISSPSRTPRLASVRRD